MPPTRPSPALLLPLLLLTPSAWGACPDPASLDELREDMDHIEEAIRTWDDALFEDAINALQASMACLDRPLTTADAARAHRLMGINEHSVDRRRACDAFVAANQLAPEYRFPDALYTSTTPIAKDYLRCRDRDGAVSPLPDPAGGELLLDGALGTSRPDDRPTVFQYHPGADRAYLGAYLWPGQAPPDYPSASDAQLGWRAGLATGGLALGSGAFGMGLAYAVDLQRPLDRSADEWVYPADEEYLHQQTVRLALPLTLSGIAVSAASGWALAANTADGGPARWRHRLGAAALGTGAGLLGASLGHRSYTITVRGDPPDDPDFDLVRRQTLLPYWIGGAIAVGGGVTLLVF